MELDAQNALIAKRREELLKQYDHVLDLYKLYWQIALQVSGFYVVAMGSILSFCAVNGFYDDSARYLVLMFCCLTSIIFTFMMVYGAFAADDLNDWFGDLSRPETLHLENWVSAHPLQTYLIVNGLLGLAIGYGCIHLFQLNVAEVGQGSLLYVALTIASVYLAFRFAKKPLWWPNNGKSNK